MRPWHRDALALIGLLALAAAAFWESVPLGLVVVGIEAIIVAVLLSVVISPGEEDNDGIG